MAIKRNNKPRGARQKVYAFVADGETEQWYLGYVQHSMGKKFSFRPELPVHKTLREEYERVLECSKNYDKVFWIIDFDVIAKEASIDHNFDKLNAFRTYTQKVALSKMCS